MSWKPIAHGRLAACFITAIGAAVLLLVLRDLGPFGYSPHVIAQGVETGTASPTLSLTALPLLTGTPTPTSTTTPTSTATPSGQSKFKVRRVNFTNNQEVRRDRFNDSVQRIADFDDDAIEWKDDNCDGETEKNWPVAYPKNSQVALNIELCVTLKPPASSITATVRGVATGTNVSLIFEKPGVTLVNGVNAVTDLKSAGTLPDFVTFAEPMAIHWTVASQDAGASTHNTYVTLAPPLTGLPIFFTLIDLTTHGANGAATEDATIRGAWSEFKARAASPRGQAPPEVLRREFNPFSGKINHKSVRLQYWNEVGPPFDTLEGLVASGNVFLCAELFEAEDLLREAVGRCGAWADLFIHALDNHGIDARLVHLFAGSTNCPNRNVCIMLVKNWRFAAGGGSSGDATYPFKWNEVTDRFGVPGQSIHNPPPFFWDHAIVRTGGKLYDPSYGRGPFGNLAAYDDASMEGFCRPLDGQRFSDGPYICQRNPAGAQLVE